MANSTQPVVNEKGKASATWRSRHRRLLLLGLAGCFLVAGLSYGAYWHFSARFWIGTADAYVHGNQNPLMPQVAGIVTAVRTDDTELVHEGDVLVELDATDVRLALERAEATLADTVRQIRKLYRQVAEQVATVQLCTRRICSGCTKTSSGHRDYRRRITFPARTSSMPSPLGRQRRRVSARHGFSSMTSRQSPRARPCGNIPR
jgi:multidrug resistance efflux pump